MNIKNTLRDSFKNLDVIYKLAIAGGIGIVILLYILLISYRHNAIPKITLNPDEQVVFIESNTYTIEGSIRPKKSLLEIDGGKVEISKDGTFEYQVNLEERRQTFTLTATNKHDDEKTISRELLIVQSYTKEELEAMRPEDLGEWKVEADDFNYLSSNQINVFQSYQNRTVVGKVSRRDLVILLEKDAVNDYCNIKNSDIQGWLACGWLQKN